MVLRSVHGREIAMSHRICEMVSTCTAALRDASDLCWARIPRHMRACARIRCSQTFNADGHSMLDSGVGHLALNAGNSVQLDILLSMR